MVVREWKGNLIMKNKATITLLLFIILTACSNDDTTSIQNSDYEETKRLVIDMLKTDDGKATLAEIFADEKMKSQLIMKQDIVKSAIEENLTSEQAKSFWKDAFQDPSFAAAYAKSLETAHKQLMKDLMQDTDYRELLLEVLQDSKMEKQIAEVINSNDVREELKNTIIETFSSPLVQEKLQNILSQSSRSGSPTDKGNGESSQTDTGSGGGGESGGQGNESGGGGGGGGGTQ